MSPDQQRSQRFDHPKDMTVGRGRIVYVERPAGSAPAGFAVPGGRITQDADEAWKWAELIDRYGRK